MIVNPPGTLYALLDERFQSTPFHGVYAGSNPAQGTNLIVKSIAFIKYIRPLLQKRINKHFSVKKAGFLINGLDMGP